MKRCKHCGQTIVEKDLTIKEISENTGISSVVIRDACKKGEIPAFQSKRGGTYYIKVVDFEKWYNPSPKIN